MSLAGASRLSRLGGLPAVTAVLVFVLTALFQAYWLRPAEDRLARIEASLEKRASSAAAAARPVRVTTTAKIADKLGQFYARFDGELGYVDWLARFYDIAQRTDVPLRHVEYRTVEPAGVPLVLHEIFVPLTADYAKVRAFAEGVLVAIPVISLDQITFRRQRANQAEVEADLRFSLYMSKK